MKHPEIQKWFQEHPQLDHFYAGAPDLNGVWRGKRLPIQQLDKILDGALRMPVSALGLDIWGRDVEYSPLVFESGDQDGVCLPTGRTPIYINDNSPRALVPVLMLDALDQPSPVDPRQILQGAVERMRAAGLTPVMAMELEFYLLAVEEERPVTPISPANNAPIATDGIMEIDGLEAYDDFFTELYRHCEWAGIAADAAISESGRGQYEINLLHCDDPIRVADDAIFFKRLVKTIAAKQSLTASFMAKPFLDRAGSGLHVHFSLLDGEGRNVFDDGGEEGSAIMQQAVAGLLNVMDDCQLIFAPHLNSYRRMQNSSHAPTLASWGYDNRTAAIRIPGGDHRARRIEHRVAGADANPYLLLASLLHGAMDGIEKHSVPEKPITGDAYAQPGKHLPTHWLDAIRQFEGSEFIDQNFSSLFHSVFTGIKWQEYNQLTGEIGINEYRAYLKSV